LRDDLSTYRSQLPGASCDAVRKHSATLSAVFEQCAGRLESVARDAQCHASDALTLEQAWPR